MTTQDQSSPPRKLSVAEVIENLKQTENDLADALGHARPDQARPGRDHPDRDHADRDR